MAYANLMVAMTLGTTNSEVLAVTSGIAERLRAGVIGVAACRPIESVCGDLQVPAKLFEEDRKQCARQSTEAEQEFRSAFAGRVERLEWRERSTLRPLADLLAHEARSADLVVVRAASEQADRTRSPDICDLVMNIARPVLIVPPQGGRAAIRRVLVGWKDTCQTHRAILDSVPLLQKAEEVILAGIAQAGELEETKRQMAEVEAWLKQHGVRIRLLAIPAEGANASQFVHLAAELDPELIVTGAYGYLRESRWVLGGITAAILDRPGRLAILSH
ncbi:MAG: universal stress protein [Proteobacteria bacterium]|nr:universal stress protein [Pseudomonadota bacterium]